MDSGVNCRMIAAFTIWLKHGIEYIVLHTATNEKGDRSVAYMKYQDFKETDEFFHMPEQQFLKEFSR